MPGEGDDRITVRFPRSLADQIRREAARQRVDVSVLIRDLVRQGIQGSAASGVQAPLIEALHSVLPAYVGPLAEAVVAARFDAVLARELAQAAAYAALLAQPAMTQERAREIVTNTLGQAIKVAKRRVREQPDLSLEQKDGAMS